jgi:hypothetical protein
MTISSTSMQHMHSRFFGVHREAGVVPEGCRNWSLMKSERLQSLPPSPWYSVEHPAIGHCKDHASCLNGIESTWRLRIQV